MTELTLKLNIREIKEFPGYFVDTCGSVYRKRNNKLEKLCVHIGKGYYRLLHVRVNHKMFYRRISHLVLETFVGEKPKGMIACHGINGSLDDSLSNLSWGTYSKNNGEDKLRDGTHSRGEGNGYAKLTEEQVLEIRRIGKTKTTIELGKIFNVSNVTIGYILNGKTWRHI